MATPVRSSYLVMATAAAVLLLLSCPPTVESATCVVSELFPCAPAVQNKSPPSSECCTKLEEQKPCFCQYLKNPAYKGYVSKSDVKRITNACDVTVPKCY